MILVEGGYFAPYVTESRSQNQKNFSLGIRNPVLSNREWYLECTGVKFTSELVSKSIAEYKYAR